MRRTAGAGLLALSLAACTSGSGSATPTPAGASAAPAAPGSPAADGTTEAAGIPGSALLQSSDVRGARAELLEEGDFAHVRPLRPCGDDRYPSDSSRTAATVKRYVVSGAEQGGTPAVVLHFVGRHTAGGAAAQFRDIEASLDRCPGGLGKGQRKWTVVESGDDSMLVRIDERFSYADEEPSTVSHYAALSRVDNAVVVVVDLGWENLGGSEDLVRDLIGKAEERAATIG